MKLLKLIVLTLIIFGYWGYAGQLVFGEAMSDEMGVFCSVFFAVFLPVVPPVLLAAAGGLFWALVRLIILCTFGDDLP